MGTAHIYDSALAIAYNLIRELVGPQWRASEVRHFRDPSERFLPLQRAGPGLPIQPIPPTASASRDLATTHGGLAPGDSVLQRFNPRHLPREIGSSARLKHPIRRAPVRAAQAMGSAPSAPLRRRS
jgi:hypothetical protein